MKMLNLSRDWLNTFGPHVLSKINRVKFGLLGPADLKRALKIDPRTPKSRRLLAVPFVGKDCPSRASEFAHPDVVIGAAILAYRYEGLRPRDTRKVLELLRDDMDLAERRDSLTGPQGGASRRTCKPTEAISLSLAYDAERRAPRSAARE